MNRLLVVCGATGTGKTGLALKLAKKFNGEILSADSRQIYKGMDIGTGKDIPEEYQYKVSSIKYRGREIGYWVDGGVRIWGYDLVSPKESYSVAQHMKVGERIVRDIWERGKLPILVGGAGLYIKAMVDGIETAKIPADFELRKKLEKMSVNELFEKLIEIDTERAGKMNESDRKNRRRLIRAVEIGGARKRRLEDKRRQSKKLRDVLMVGLKMEREKLNQRIKERIEKRIKDGIEKEIMGLLKMGVKWEDQSMQALGYRQWRDYFEGDKQKAEVTEEWSRAEKKYAKKQMSWFKRDGRINWIDVNGEGWEKEVEEKVKRWYFISSDAKKD